MKQTQQIILRSENLMNSSLTDEDNTSNESPAYEFIYDEQLLRIQIKQKYREQLKNINTHNQQTKTFQEIFRLVISILYAFFEQLWIELIPQCFRGRAFGQKSSSIMNRFPQLNCGNVESFLERMKKNGKYFSLILQQKTLHEQYFQIHENLFENTQESNKKLSYILQCQTFSISSEDLSILQKSQNSTIKLQSFAKSHMNFPLLLVCRYNFLGQLKIMGEIQLSGLQKQTFQGLFDQIKKHISDIKNLQSECKRQVLTEILHSER